MRASSIVLLAAGCCWTSGAPATPPVVAPPVVAPPVVTPPVVTPPIGASAGASMATCLQLCERAGQCMELGGAPRSPETADCAQACSVGHAYATLPPQAYTCMSQPTCMIFESCLNAALGAVAAGLATGAAAGLPPGGTGTPPGAGTAAPSAAPAGWPEGFPVLPGGTPMAAPPSGPVRVGLLSYPGIGAADLDARYHAALREAGWIATESEAGPEARRFTATRGGTVSVSIYEEGGTTLIQTMQF